MRHKIYDKVIVWGAGKELQSLLNEINLRVDYIVDSNPVLHGKKINNIVYS